MSRKLRLILLAGLLLCVGLLLALRGVEAASPTATPTATPTAAPTPGSLGPFGYGTSYGAQGPRDGYTR